MRWTRARPVVDGWSGGESWGCGDGEGGSGDDGRSREQRDVRELSAGCARECGTAAPGPRRVVSRTVKAERDPGAPVRVDVVVRDVGGAAGGDDDACVAGKSTVRSGGCEAWGDVRCSSRASEAYRGHGCGTRGWPTAWRWSPPLRPPRLRRGRGGAGCGRARCARPTTPTRRHARCCAPEEGREAG